MVEGQTSRPGSGGPHQAAASPHAYLIAPRLVRGALRIPANDNPVPPRVRLRRAVLRIILATAAAGGLWALFAG